MCCLALVLSGGGRPGSLAVVGHTGSVVENAKGGVCLGQRPCPALSARDVGQTQMQHSAPLGCMAE